MRFRERFNAARGRPSSVVMSLPMLRFPGGSRPDIVYVPDPNAFRRESSRAEITAIIDIGANASGQPLPSDTTLLSAISADLEEDSFYRRAVESGDIDDEWMALWFGRGWQMAIEEGHRGWSKDGCVDTRIVSAIVCLACRVPDIATRQLAVYGAMVGHWSKRAETSSALPRFDQFQPDYRAVLILGDVVDYSYADHLRGFVGLARNLSGNDAIANAFFVAALTGNMSVEIDGVKTKDERLGRIRAFHSITESVARNLGRLPSS